MVRTFLVVASLSACTGGGKPEPTPPSPPVEEPTQAGNPDAAHTACAADADCVIVETACCDHCNGGKAEAFNKAFAEQHKPTGCEGTGCTKRGCGPAVATCDAGVCTASIQPL